MKRNSIIFPVKDFLEQIPDLLDSRIEIRIDEANFDEIAAFLLEKDKGGNYIHKKKFTRILYVALKGQYNEDLYDKEKVSSKAKFVTAMKFKGKDNFRIGCKEINCKDKKIIMVVLFHKKTKPNSKRERQIYETIGGYEYDC